jgi:predicted transcriptional regulator
MTFATIERQARRPRFRRAVEPPAFRVTDDDVEIVRQVGRHRLIRSTDIAALVGRSLDRTNDRLMRLFHAGYVDRPRAQLDRFPTSGSAHYIYALADQGARLLRQRDGVAFANPELSRKNREAGRPFIEHQIEIVNFQVALQRAVNECTDLRLVETAQMAQAATSQQQRPRSRAPFALRTKLSDQGRVREATVIPDLVFGLDLANGERHNFMVEIDRGTMPVHRSDARQTSFERKMRVYLAAHAARQHERQFGWKNFRVLVVTTTSSRISAMLKAWRGLRTTRANSAPLFLFTTFDELRASSPLAVPWLDGTGGPLSLI